MNIFEKIEEQRNLSNFYEILENQNLGIEEIIKDLMKNYLKSSKFINATKGTNYYKFMHDILNRIILYRTPTGDYNAKTNVKVKAPYHNFLVNQKSSYISGNPWDLIIKDEKLREIIETEYLDIDDIMEIIDEITVDSANTGDSYLHYYIDSEGNMQYSIYDNTEIIAIYDNRYNKYLEKVIRFYTVIDADGKKIYKIELWDNKMTYFFEMYIKNNEYVIRKDFSVPLNPQPHYLTVSGETVNEESFGKVPFILIKNNKFSTTDLEPIKDMQDEYDITNSDWSNAERKSIDEVIIVTGIGPNQSLTSIIEGIRANGGVILPNKESTIETLTQAVQFENKEARLKNLRTSIFELGNGVSVDKEDLANISGISLKLMYNNLDMKANKLIKTIKNALYELFEIILLDINNKNNTAYTIDLIDIVPNKKLIVDTKENAETKKIEVETLLLLKGTVSDETILENLEIVEDVELEKERLMQELDSKLLDSNLDDEDMI